MRSREIYHRASSQSDDRRLPEDTQAQHHAALSGKRSWYTPIYIKIEHLWYLVKTSLAARLLILAGAIVLICIAVLIWVLLRNPLDVPQLDDSITGDMNAFAVSVERSGYTAHDVYDGKSAHITLYIDQDHASQASLTEKLKQQFTISGLLASSLKTQTAFSIFDNLETGTPVLVVGEIPSSMYEALTWENLAPDAFTPQHNATSANGTAANQPSSSEQNHEHLRFANYYAKVSSSKLFDHLENLTSQQDMLDGERLERYRADASSSAHKELLKDNRIALYKGTTHTGVYWACLVQYQSDGMASVCLLEANHPALLSWMIDHKGML